MSSYLRSASLQFSAAVAILVMLGCERPPEIREDDFQRENLGKALRDLPNGFLLGTATAAHQIEGGNTNNDWWEFEQGTHEDGRPHILNDDSSIDAAKSWPNMSALDLPRIEELGSNAYRFSIEWSRLVPNRGEWNSEAARVYRQFVLDLRARGITPMVTLHHFTTPKWAADLGGFESREVMSEFAKFSSQVAILLGDQVDLWCTLNEPNVYVYSGYIDGVFPPGIEGDTARAAEVLANMLEAHAMSARHVKEFDTIDADGDGHAALTGIAHHVRVFQAASAGTLDSTIAGLTDDFFNEAPVRAGATGRIQLSVPGTIEIDREVPGLRGSFDFLGINYYTRFFVRADLTSPSLSNLYYGPGRPTNDLGWDVYPEGLYLFLKRFSAFGWPLYITENGMADEDGRQRPDYLRAHIHALELALEDGVDVRGYFHWTLMDNFEWAEGYHARFGLYSVPRENPEARHPTEAVGVFQQIACNAGTPTPGSTACQ